MLLKVSHVCRSVNDILKFIGIRMHVRGFPGGYLCIIDIETLVI